MMFDLAQHASANDNRFRVVVDKISRKEVHTRLTQAMDTLAHKGAVDAVLIEGLFSSLFDLAYRSSMARMDDPARRHVFERYNQLSRFTGELELLKADLMATYVDGLLEP